MASERTVEKIASWIQRKVATMLVRDLKDPRGGFLLTVTRVNVTKDLETCAVFYSVLGGEKERRRAAAMLEHATPWIQREVASGLRLRSAPRLHFEYDEAVEGAQRMTSLLDRLAEERARREAEGGPGEKPNETKP